MFCWNIHVQIEKNWSDIEQKKYQNLIFKLLVYKAKYAQLSAVGSYFSPIFVRKNKRVLLQLIIINWVLILTLENIYELFTKVLISDKPPTIIV